MFPKPPWPGKRQSKAPKAKDSTHQSDERRATKPILVPRSSQLAILSKTNFKGEIEMNLEKIKWILLAVYLILAGLVLLGVSLGGGIISVIAGSAP